MMTTDTNVLVYLLDQDEAAKQTTARTVVDELMRRESMLGLQCVGEFQNVLRRKLRLTPWEAAQEAHNLLMSFATFRASETAAVAALGKMATGRWNYWDALLIHSAAEAGCSVLFTEDSQAMTTVAGLELVNPFAAGGRLSDRAREVLEL